MSEQESGTHGPREDDALKREVRSELQAHRATRAEEWLEPEPPGEDEPEATWVLEGRPGATPPGEDWETIELRSNLARHLEGGHWRGGRWPAGAAAPPLRQAAAEDGLRHPRSPPVVSVSSRECGSHNTGFAASSMT
jgi:hypothetical protein